MLLQGHRAAHVRCQASKLLVRYPGRDWRIAAKCTTSVRATHEKQKSRYLGGGITLVEEVCARRGFQEQLAAEQPDDPRRVFGEAVEDAGNLSTFTIGMGKRLLEDVREVVRTELSAATTALQQQQQHVWISSKRLRNHSDSCHVAPLCTEALCVS